MVVEKRNLALGLTAIFFILLTTGIAAGSDNPQDSSQMYEFLDQFHGHTCAGSLMGARLGLAAKAELERAGIEGKLKAQMFNHSCAVDGVQVAAGTTYGNNAITVKDEDEMRLVLTDEKSGRQVEAVLTDTAKEKGAASRELRKKIRELSAGSAERQKLEQDVEAIFTGFKTAETNDIVFVKMLNQKSDKESN